MDVFERLAPFIQDFIYRSGWEELHANQVAACEVIFDSDDNLLLSSGTASGKTEAAFLPVLTDLYENPSNSVGVLYISPLKALINDQFKRLEQLLEDSHIPVTKWHGDASVTQKNRLVKNPEGILQIHRSPWKALLPISAVPAWLCFRIFAMSSLMRSITSCEMSGAFSFCVCWNV